MYNSYPTKWYIANKMLSPNQTAGSLLFNGWHDAQKLSISACDKWNKIKEKASVILRSTLSSTITAPQMHLFDKWETCKKWEKYLLAYFKANGAIPRVRKTKRCPPDCIFLATSNGLGGVESSPIQGSWQRLVLLATSHIKSLSYPWRTRRRVKWWLSDRWSVQTLSSFGSHKRPTLEWSKRPGGKIRRLNPKAPILRRSVHRWRLTLICQNCIKMFMVIPFLISCEKQLDIAATLSIVLNCRRYRNFRDFGEHFHPRVHFCSH